MKFDDAVRMLRTGADWPDLADAIRVVIQSPTASIWDLVLGLKHKGVIAEQAAFALYKKTNRDLPRDPKNIVVDLPTWITWLTDSEPEIVDQPLVRIYKGDALTLERLREIISNYLTRREQLILVLYYVEEMTFLEIAEVLGEKEATIKASRIQILKQIRSHFKSNAESFSRLFKDLVA